MLGLATGTELRLALWAAIALTVAGSLLYGNYERDRANAILAKDKAAVVAQAAQDRVTSEETISGLRKQLAELVGAVPAIGQPPPRIRVCVPTGNVRPEVATAGAQPGVPPHEGPGGSLLSGRAGSQPGDTGDIGPGVRALRDAGEVLAIYRGVTWDWSVKQAEPAR